MQVASLDLDLWQICGIGAMHEQPLWPTFPYTLFKQHTSCMYASVHALMT